MDQLTHNPQVELDKHHDSARTDIEALRQSSGLLKNDISEKSYYYWLRKIRRKS